MTVPNAYWGGAAHVIELALYGCPEAVAAFGFRAPVLLLIPPSAGLYQVIVHVDQPEPAISAPPFSNDVNALLDPPAAAPPESARDANSMPGAIDSTPCTPEVPTNELVADPGARQGAPSRARSSSAKRGLAPSATPSAVNQALRTDLAHDCFELRMIVDTDDRIGDGACVAISSPSRRAGCGTPASCGARRAVSPDGERLIAEVCGRCRS